MVEVGSVTGLDDYQTLIGLVSHYSPSGEEGGAAGWLVGRMLALGYDQAYIDSAGNPVGIKGSGDKQLVLLGHIDTVPGEIPVRIDGDRLYARGSVDAKGPLAAFVDAAAMVTPGERWRLIVIGAVGEERDSDGARYVAHQYDPVYAIIGEPSRWDRVTLGYKGSAWAEVSVRLPLSHSAGQGMSACESAVEVWEEVKDWAESFNAGRSRAFDQVSPSLRGWDSGDDGFEEWAQMQIGVRLPLDLPPEAWYKRLEQLAGQARIHPKGHPIEAYKGEKNTPLVRAFLAAIREQGGRPSFVLKTGTADLNIVAPVWRCPAVAYGPGDSSLDHTPDEHISLTEYSQAVGVLRTVLSQSAFSP